MLDLRARGLERLRLFGGASDLVRCGRDGFAGRSLEDRRRGFDRGRLRLETRLLNVELEPLARGDFFSRSDFFRRRGLFGDADRLVLAFASRLARGALFKQRGLHSLR